MHDGVATAPVAKRAAPVDRVQLERTCASQPRPAIATASMSAGTAGTPDPATSTATPPAPAPAPAQAQAQAQAAAPADVRMPRLHKAFTALQRIYKQLDTGQKLYLNCVLAVLLFFATYPLHHAWNFIGLLMLALVFWFGGMVYDALTLYKRIYATHIGKGLLLLAFTGLTNFAIALANQRINDVAGVDPSKFPHTEIFVAILSIPFIALLILMTLYAASVLFLPIYGLFFFVMDAGAKAFFSAGLLKRDESAYPWITGIFRLVGFSIFAGVVMFCAKRMLGDYDRFMTDTAEKSVYHLEMYEKSPCDVPTGARVAFLDNDNIVYALRVGHELKFFPQPCKRDAK
ncbi:hypothetical protein I6G57_30990 [Burkholderia oklahomensis]|nr:hypothetical protein WG70_18100 [Burkholderia oklahomensis EO147]QPS40195.1 hypothetical protein I6G57_30990 [Burkholderia oklahomensis]